LYTSSQQQANEIVDTELGRPVAGIVRRLLHRGRPLRPARGFVSVPEAFESADHSAVPGHSGYSGHARHARHSGYSGRAIDLHIVPTSNYKQVRR
jgi:hypothetical protein